MLSARWPRLVSLLIGVWFVVSTLAFRTESSAGFNRLMLGLLVIGSAIQALWASWFRFVNLAIGIWMIFSAEVFRHGSTFLQLSTLVAGAALVVFSSLRSPPLLIDPRREFANYRP
jgi:hypothetical protein